MDKIIDQEGQVPEETLVPEVIDQDQIKKPIIPNQIDENLEDESEVPEVPETPVVPEDPEVPEVPEIPEVPEGPEV